MKIRDKVSYLIAEKPQSLIIGPIIIIVVIGCALIAVFMASRPTKKPQPAISKPINTVHTSAPVFKPPQTLNAGGGVSLPEDPQ